MRCQTGAGSRYSIRRNHDSAPSDRDPAVEKCRLGYLVMSSNAVRDNSVTELACVNGDASEVGAEELEIFIASFPITPARRSGSRCKLLSDNCASRTRIRCHRLIWYHNGKPICCGNGDAAEWKRQEFYEQRISAICAQLPANSLQGRQVMSMLGTPYFVFARTARRPGLRCLNKLIGSGVPNYANIARTRRKKDGEVNT
jgi:hypothetical protein